MRNTAECKQYANKNNELYYTHLYFATWQHTIKDIQDKVEIDLKIFFKL